jgi:hypothetical protein
MYQTVTASPGLHDAGVFAEPVEIYAKVFFLNYTRFTRS